MSHPSRIIGRAPSMRVQAMTSASNLNEPLSMIGIIS